MGLCEDWMKDNDPVFLSNGPGDPAALDDMVSEVKKVGNEAHCRICSGTKCSDAHWSQDLKLGFGHRCEPPRARPRDRTREITSQNHGHVDVEGIEAAGGEATHINLNDQTLAASNTASSRLPLFSSTRRPAPVPTTRLISWLSGSSTCWGLLPRAGPVVGFLVVSLAIFGSAYAFVGLKLSGPHGPWASAWSGPCCCFTSPRRLSPRAGPTGGSNPSTFVVLVRLRGNGAVLVHLHGPTPG